MFNYRISTIYIFYFIFLILDYNKNNSKIINEDIPKNI